MTATVVAFAFGAYADRAARALMPISRKAKIQFAKLEWTCIFWLPVGCDDGVTKE
jgi:hypothetical protein